MIQRRQVLISGGGPVGLYTALLLGRRGIEVTVFDDNDRLQKDPRAATTHPGTLEILNIDGLIDDMARVGLTAYVFQFWDRPSDTKVAEFDHRLLRDDTDFPFVIQCEQFKTAELILKRLRVLPNVEVLFDHTVTDLTQDADSVTVSVMTPQGAKSFKGSYLIGADGGGSTVRKEADIDFEGFTYPERFLVLTTPFDFEKHRGFCYRTYVADPEEWCNCFKVSGDGPPGLWRTVFPTDPDQSEDAILSDDAVQLRLQKFFARSEPYEIVHRNLYVTHQRVAATFVKGRVLLAGDAAHVNNSIGGMGLNGGLQDAANLAGKLTKVILEGEPESELALYDKQRRTVTHEFVQQQTIANKKRLEALDPEMRKRHLGELAETAADLEKARQFLLRTSMIAMQRRVNAITLETP
jgi:3-(3-hydroxy-phenyl)propionate hydroxylase